METRKNIPLAIANIFDIAKKDKWVMEYDSDLDNLYWSKPKLSKKSILKQFMNDFSLYINPSGLIEGIFVEYAKYNFISHNKEYEALLDDSNMKEIGEGRYVLKETKETDMLLRGVSGVVSQEALQAVGQGIDLDKAVEI